jgi:ABC-2 type transport system permease protein
VVEPPAGRIGLADVGTNGRLYRRLVVAQIRSEWQYRTSFVLFALAQALITALELAAILIVLTVVDDLGGWTADEVILLYGLATVPFTLTDVVVSPVEDLSTHVRSGTFDRLLLRPLSPLVQICALEFELRRLGKSIPTVAALIWGLASVDVAWNPGRVAVVAVALASGVVIYSALWIATASVAFWAVATQEAANAVTYGGDFANQYPLHLYPGWVRAVLGWLIPLAFVAYVPALAILDAPNPLGVPAWFVGLSPVAAGAAAAMAGVVWSAGIRHYQGTGS